MSRKTLVFDVDGLFANFSAAYEQVIIEVSGRNLFLPGDADNAPTWDFDYFRGYTKEEHRAAWKAILRDRYFWTSLKPIRENCDFVFDRADKLFREHDIYFLTNRSGIDVKYATEIWLREFVTRWHTPTVLLTNDVTGKDKGLLLRGLRADAFVDDKWENVIEADAQAPYTHTYLYNRRYNAPVDEAGTKHSIEGTNIARVDTLQDFFTREGLL